MLIRPLVRPLCGPLCSQIVKSGGGGGGVPDPVTYDYLIEEQSDWATIFANSDATLSGKTIAVAPGTYTWPTQLSSRTLTSEVVIRSLYPNSRAIISMASGGHVFQAPSRYRFFEMRFYAPFAPGVDSNAGPACALRGAVNGLHFDQCEIYGNLRDLVIANGFPDQMGDIGWRGFFGLDGTTNLSTNGLKFTDCTIHSGRRLLNLPGGTGPLELIGNRFYDFGVDAMLISGAQPALKINWNVFDSPLSGWNGNDIAGTFDPATDRFTSTAPHGLTGTPTLNISPNTGTVPGGLSLLDDYNCTVIDANVIQWPTNVTSTGTDVRIYREPSHADFMQAVPGAADWNGFEVIGNRFTSERYDDLESYRDAQVIFFEDINAADTDANHYRNGLVALNVIWSENTTHGIRIYNPIDCTIRNNTLASLPTLSGALPIGFARQFSSGTGSGNKAFGNICQANPTSIFSGDRLAGNFLAGFGQATNASTFVGPDTPPASDSEIQSRFAIRSDSVPFLMEPKCGAGGTGYVDYAARTYSLPSIPPFDLTYVSEIIGATSGSFIVNTTSGGGTIYWMVSTEARTASQVIAQGTATAKGTQAVSTTGNQSSIAVSGLSASTNYYLYVVQVNGSDQSQMIVRSWATIASAGFSVVDNQGSAYLTRTGGFSSPTNTKQITFAIRGSLNAGNGSVRALLRQSTSAQPLQIDLQSTNAFRLSARNAGGTIIGRVDSGSTLTTALGTFWLVASLDLNAGTGLVYLNGVSSKTGTDILTNDTINFSATSTLSLLATPTGTGLLDINVEYLFLDNRFVDLTNPADLVKFQTLAGMLSDGSGPTGSAPLLFMTGNAATWNAGTNQGGGGAFAATGTFIDV